VKRLGLIGGTGLDHWSTAGTLLDVDTVYGLPSAQPVEYECSGLRVLFLPRHGAQHQIPPHAVNYRANIDAFRQLDVDGVIAVNAVGGISNKYPPGRLAVPDQLIDYTWGRKHSFSMDPGDELQHIEFAEPFSTRLCQGLLSAAGMTGLDVHRDGCVAVSQGPTWAAGVDDVPVGMQAIEDTLAEAMLEVRKLLGTFFEILADVC